MRAANSLGGGGEAVDANLPKAEAVAAARAFDAIVGTPVLHYRSPRILLSPPFHARPFFDNMFCFALFP